MKIEIKVPSPGESITQVQLASWLVENGAYVDKDQEIAEIDSDKATLSISAEESGKIEILVEAGETIEVGSVIAIIDSNAKGKATSSKLQASGASAKEVSGSKANKSKNLEDVASNLQPATRNPQPTITHISPLAQKLMDKNDVSEAELLDFFKSLRVGKKDVEFYLEQKDQIKSGSAPVETSGFGGTRNTERKKMSTLRMKLAERLVSVKNDTAMLTTFNEVNMRAIMEIRKQYKDIFKEKHGIGLGFMSFFTKAVTEAFKHFPVVNAQIDGEEIIYHDYADIGIAVSAPKGLVVPVLRNAETMSLADIETNIKSLAIKARDNKITLDDMKGGTFTITNGGVFGSMLSTPIINPPQSAILGMHNIVERPIAVNGVVEIHPVMYVALSYDHRIIDGKDSVRFLVKVKEMLEDPVKMMFSGNDPHAQLLEL